MRKLFLILALAIVGNVAMVAQENFECKNAKVSQGDMPNRVAPRKVSCSEFGLSIAGVNVTSSNKNNISFPGQTAGTVSYNSSTNVLTLNGVKATVTNGRSFIHATNDITIQVDGDNKITQTGDSLIYLRGSNSVIQGTGTLDYDNSQDTWTGISFLGTLTIQGGVTVIIHASYFGIAGENLVIDHSALMVKGGTGDASLKIKSLTMNGCGIITPAGAHFESGYVRTADGEICTENIVIGSLAPEDYYGITIGGVEVNKYNASNVLGDGKVKVTKETSGNYDYCITLYGVKYTNASVPFIDTDENVRLFVASENEPNEIASGLIFNGNVEITGNGGLLDINCAGNGISFKKNLIFYNTITRTRIHAQGVGLCGVGGSAYCELNGVMEVTGGTAAANNASYYVHQVSSQYTAILTKGTINATQRRIDDGGSEAKTVKVLPLNGWSIYFDDYNTSITKDNYTDILGNGRLKYEPMTATLTMKNCTIQSTTGDGLTAYQGFRLKLEGNNVIEGIDYGLDVDDYSVWVEGPGSLVARATGVDGTGMYGVGPLRVFGGARLEAYGESVAITCIDESLEVDSAIVKAKGDYYSIRNVSELKLRKADIISNHTWDAAQHKFLNAAGQEANDTIVISNDYYPIRIAGKLATPQNAANLSFPGMASGSMSYDKPSHTLIINNVQGNYMQSMPLIETAEDHLTVVVAGTNNILLTKAQFMKLKTSSGNDGDATIQGGGTLTVSNLGAKTYGIKGDDIYLKGNTTLNIQSDDYAIYGYFDIDNSTADLTGDGYSGAIYSLYSVNNCYIESPDSIALAGSKMINLYTGKRVYPTHVVFKPGKGQTRAKAYDIYFYDGIDDSYYYVTDSTCANITFPSLKQGTVSYDPAAKVLTLNNAYIDTLSWVEVSESHVTIELVGENTIIYKPTSSSSYALKTNSADTIQGSGSLHLVGCLYGYFDIIIRNTSISIQDGRLYMLADDVVIENSNVEITVADGVSAMYDVTSLTLTDCEIVDPVGAVYDATARTVLLDGNTVSHLRIEGKRTGLEEIINAQGIMHKTQKIMHDGIFYILRDGKLFNALGGRIR